MENFSNLAVLVLLGTSAASFAFFLNKRRNDAWREFASSRGLTGPAPGLFSTPVITGSFEGLEVKIDLESRGSGKNRQVFTRCSVRVPHCLPQGLVVSKEDFFTGMGRFFGLQDIQTGDPAFDGKVVLRGKDPSEVQAYFSHPTRRQAAETIVSKGTFCRIEQNHVLLLERGVLVEQSGLTDLLESALSAARLLHDERRSSDC